MYVQSSLWLHHKIDPHPPKKTNTGSNVNAIPDFVHPSSPNKFYQLNIPFCSH